MDRVHCAHLMRLRCRMQHLGALLQLLNVLAQLEIGVGVHVLLLLLLSWRGATVRHVDAGRASGELAVWITIGTGGHLRCFRGGDNGKRTLRDGRLAGCGGVDMARGGGVESAEQRDP
jgi:hypothetical protein